MYCERYRVTLKVKACLGNQDMKKDKCQNCQMGEDARAGFFNDEDVVSLVEKKMETIETDGPPTKKCTTCGEIKPLAQFYNSKASKDGKFPHCKECDRIKNKERLKARDKERSREKGMIEKPEEKMPEENTAKKKRCSSCGIAKLLKEFSNNKATRDGKCYSCKACDRERGKAGRVPTVKNGPRGEYKKKEKEIVEVMTKPEVQVSKPPIKPLRQVNGYAIELIDFKDYPDLYDFIKKEAREDFRNVSGQMLSILSDYMEMKNEGF